MKKATFAGGCFWCIQAAFQILPGVKAVSGYTYGEKEYPTYEEVSSGATGHYEAVEVTYDPEKTSYEQILDIFWQSIDPTDSDGQFADKGPQYRTAIFYQDQEQKQKAEQSKQKIKEMLKKPIATEILPATRFYPAEDYHQDYHEKNPIRYQLYKKGSGRESKLKELWDKK